MLDEAELLPALEELLVEKAKQTAAAVAALVAQKVEQARLEERRRLLESSQVAEPPDADAAIVRSISEDTPPAPAEQQQQQQTRPTATTSPPDRVPVGSVGSEQLKGIVAHALRIREQGQAEARRPPPPPTDTAGSSGKRSQVAAGCSIMSILRNMQRCSRNRAVQSPPEPQSYDDSCSRTATKNSVAPCMKPEAMQPAALMQEPMHQQDLPPAPVSAQVRATLAGEASPSRLPSLAGQHLAQQAELPSKSVPALSATSPSRRGGQSDWERGRPLRQAEHDDLLSSLQEMTQALKSANIIGGSTDTSA